MARTARLFATIDVNYYDDDRVIAAGPQLSATTAGIVATQDYPTDHGGLALVQPISGSIVWRSTIGQPAFLDTPPVVFGPDIAMVVGRPNNGPSSLLLRSLATGSLITDRALRSEQAPLTFTALAPALYGTGLASSGDPGFIEQFGPRGVTWRVSVQGVSARSAR